VRKTLFKQPNVQAFKVANSEGSLSVMKDENNISKMEPTVELKPIQNRNNCASKKDC
jgi:hypothetical protein